MRANQPLGVWLLSLVLLSLCSQQWHTANYITGMLTVYSYNVTNAFQSESTLYSCLNVKELFAWNRRDIWRLSDCNRARTHNHLVRKRTLKHLRTKWLWLRVSLQSLNLQEFQNKKNLTPNCKNRIVGQ